MSKLGSMTLSGASGAEYNFDVYSSDTTWRENVSCVYYISLRRVKTDGGGSHAAIYIGETEDLKARLGDHHKQTCFDRNNYNAISLHLEANGDRRLEIEADLVEALNPPCNG